MSLNLSNLKIIRKSTTTRVDTVVNEETNVKNVKLSKLEDTYKLVQKGSMSDNDFRKTVMRTQPKILTPINPLTRDQLNIRLKELIRWYLEIKKLLMAYDTSKTILESNPNKLKLRKFQDEIKELEICINSNRTDKSQSDLVRSILDQIISDDELKPLYSVSKELIDFLIKTNRNSSFIKEIALCFGLYRKYINRLAENFINDINNEIPIEFKSINDLQPRFNMIFNHIKSSNPIYGNSNELNITTIINQRDLDNINKELNIVKEVSNLGLKKRLTEINNWLNNGLIHTQHSFNRLYNLKVKRNDRNKSKVFEEPINNNYAIWCLLKDIESFIASIEDLLNGKSFLIGINNKDTLEVLDVNY